MKIYKNKNGITLIALVITIIIMLLLAVLAIQLTLGENGLIAKSTQAKIQQAKSELYDIAKLEYLKLRTKAIVTNKEAPKVEAVLTEPNFLNKYNVVRDNITNKNNEFIETKENLLKFLREETSLSSTPSSPPTPSTPSTPAVPSIPGVEAKDIDKLILQLNIKDNTELTINNNYNSSIIELISPDGSVENINSSINKNYSIGTYKIKIKASSTSGIRGLEIIVDNTKASIDIIHWGKNPSYSSSLSLYGVDKISYPEPDLYTVYYTGGVFNTIPENLFINKLTNSNPSCFLHCNNITDIPQNLFKNCKNFDNFDNLFKDCKNLSNIPRNLFKYNTKVERFNFTFTGTKVVSIPENLFEFNIEATQFMGTFYNTPLANIPENLFKFNIDAKIFTKHLERLK